MSTNNLRPDIQAALQDKPGNKVGIWYSWIKIRGIEKHIQPDEQVQHLAMGKIGKLHGVLVVTDKRAFFYTRKGLRDKIQNYPRANITSVETVANPLWGSVTIKSASDATTVQNIPSAKAAEIQSTLQD